MPKLLSDKKLTETEVQLEVQPQLALLQFPSQHLLSFSFVLSFPQQHFLTELFGVISFSQECFELFIPQAIVF